MSTPVTVIAAFRARPGRESELRTLLSGLLAPTRKEAGCLNYDLHVASDNPAKFLFHENWTNQSDLDAHLQSAHVKTLLERVDELCAEAPQITIWKRID